MKVKIDTKEIFHVITFEEEILAANMTEELTNLLLSFLSKDPRHLVIRMNNVKVIEEQVAKALTTTQQTFYESNVSLVFCELSRETENFLDGMELLEVMNVTPSESEAWDIVQMETIERELLDEQ